MDDIKEKFEKYWQLAIGLDDLIPKLETVIESYTAAHVQFTKEISEEPSHHNRSGIEMLDVTPQMFKQNLEGMLNELENLKQAKAYCKTMATLLGSDSNKDN